MIDFSIEQLMSDPWGQLLLHHLAAGGLRQGYVTILVAARLIGLLLLTPGMGASVVPLSARAGLVVSLSLIVAPGLLSSGPVTGSDIAQVAYESSGTASIPGSLTELLGSVVNECALGTLLGVGVMSVFSGLRLGGEFLDRHTGIGLGSVLNPDWTSSSVCGSLSQWLGIATVLLIDSVSGRWLLLQSLMQTFRDIPLSSQALSTPAISLLIGLVNQSFELGLRVALPIIATMLLVDATIAFSSRGNFPAFQPALHAARAAVGVTVLMLTISTIPDALATTFAAALELVGDPTTHESFRP